MLGNSWIVCSVGWVISVLDCTGGSPEFDSLYGIIWFLRCTFHSEVRPKNSDFYYFCILSGWIQDNRLNIYKFYRWPIKCQQNIFIQTCVRWSQLSYVASYSYFWSVIIYYYNNTLQYNYIGPTLFLIYVNDLLRVISSPSLCR